MCPPRVRSHVRQLQPGVISENLPRLGKPDCGCVLVDRFVRPGEILSLARSIERIDCAVDVRVERRTLVGAEVVAVGARRGDAPRSTYRTRTRLRIPLTDDGIESVFARLVDHR